MRVALDAGHGASRGRPHTGAAADSLVEDDLALDFVMRIGHHLRAAGHETVYTRADTALVPLAARVKTATDRDCQLFVSVHCNAGPASASGVEAFVAEGDRRSGVIALRMVEAISGLGMRSRGVKWDSSSQHSRLAVLRGACRRMPAVLLEIGFLTNPRDSGLLSDKHWREAAAKELARQAVS